MVPAAIFVSVQNATFTYTTRDSHLHSDWLIALSSAIDSLEKFNMLNFENWRFARSSY